MSMTLSFAVVFQRKLTLTLNTFHCGPHVNDDHKLSLIVVPQKVSGQFYLTENIGALSQGQERTISGV